ncbi:TetR/AcrR family transcriptional regulator [Magnetospirillum aberrantis]|uniref:TetR/AcrR family transcriptional regulator n=1 Tax=Magnetospirillum aberrantis SpK TaxID=908842 RepID=A0A7C9UZ59_9PROT|nr:TetR/AcrR family transcriptional regulator [Magnetospirillum aberrantis]NFV80293.1 TetR/AcrR family transcriptional regulator [Magnetospirillum aberrantis SpK]
MGNSANQDKIRRRLPRSERERLIVDEAIRFFAEVGFEGQTRALAQRLGVTQPLLYRYFPDKEALIERVYQEVFEGGWDPAWEQVLTDRSRPLAARLHDVYRLYTLENFTFERVRLFMFAGLKDRAIASRYLTFLRDHLFIPLACEVRATAGLDTVTPPTEAEIEAAAGLHGAVGYVGLRRWVYQTAVPINVEEAVSALIETFVAGAPGAARMLAEKG